MNREIIMKENGRSDAKEEEEKNEDEKNQRNPRDGESRDHLL